MINENKKHRKRSSSASSLESSSTSVYDGTTSTTGTSTITTSSLKASRKKQKVQPIVYYAKYPSDLSSIQTPSSLYNTSRESIDGIYENMPCISQSERSLSSSKSNDTSAVAYDSTNEKEQKRVESRQRRRRRNKKNNFLNIEESYLGPMTRKEAEQYVNRNTDFRLYHRIPSNASSNIDYLKDHIHLYIVYKDRKGRTNHCPVQRCCGPYDIGTNRSRSNTNLQENFY